MRSRRVGLGALALLSIVVGAGVLAQAQPSPPPPLPSPPVTPAQAPIAAPTHMPTPVAATPDVFSEVGPSEPADGATERGRTLLRLGDLPGAARAFRAAIAADAKNIAAREGLRNTLAEARRTDLLPPVLDELTRLYLEAGDRDRAGSRFEELIALAPTYTYRPQLAQALGRDAGGPRKGETHWTDRLRSFLGLFVIMGIAWALSTNRRAVKLRIVLWGVGMQLLFAVIVLWTPPGRAVFDTAQAAVDRVIAFSDEGAAFLFGNLYHGMPSPPRGAMSVIDGTSLDVVQIGLIFAFQVLPTIIFIGSLMSVLYHFGVIQKVVHGIAWVMQRTMGTSGAESLSTAANIFVGQTEAPLVVKPYVATMTQSELMAVMVGGFATVAGGVLAAYARFGIDAGHLMAASFMGGPATLVLAKLMVPETEQPLTMGKEAKDPPRTTTNFIDAAAAGASEGMTLAINVAAMLIAFIALIAMVNWGLALLGLSLGEIFGWAFYPLSYFLGVDTQDLLAFGNLLGTKVSLNEFVAYIQLENIRSTISERTFVIATYALCGFANFSSIGIQIGGIGAIAPERRGDLAKLGLRAMFAGALASLMTACIAGILI
jgi:concentrative nucleoside transporter, CNT family